jgi:hypothetical protein
MSVVSVGRCLIEVSAAGRSLAQRSVTDCDRGTSYRGLGLRGLSSHKKKALKMFFVFYRTPGITVLK